MDQCHEEAKNDLMYSILCNLPHMHGTQHKYLNLLQVLIFYFVLLVKLSFYIPAFSYKFLNVTYRIFTIFFCKLFPVYIKVWIFSGFIFKSIKVWIDISINFIFITFVELYF